MNVEDQLRAAITRQAQSYEVPLPDIDGFAAGATLRRRRHRMAAALAACAVLAIVASAFLAGRSWWDTRGPAPADQPIQGSTTSPLTDDPVGIIGPPPPGTPPTGPATGELVAAAELYRSGTWVYADGRLINVVTNHFTKDVEFRGLVVRDLTPSGVEAMRSFLLDGTKKLNPPDDPDDFGALLVREGGRLMTAQPFAACGARQVCPPFEHPEEWLPASAWEDPVLRPFVPHSYRVCLGGPEDPWWSPAEVLSAEAVDLLLGPESPLADRQVGPEGLCRELANPVARELADVMDQTAQARQESNLALNYVLPSAGALEFGPVLPHGGTFSVPG